MKDPIRRDSLITIIGLSLLVALFLFAVYLPGRQAAATVRGEIAAAERSIREIPLRIAELESLKKQINRRNDYLQQTEPLMPRAANVPTILRQVTDLAKHSDLAVTKLKAMAMNRNGSSSSPNRSLNAMVIPSACSTAILSWASSREMPPKTHPAMTNASVGSTFEWPLWLFIPPLLSLRTPFEGPCPEGRTNCGSCARSPAYRAAN